MQPCFIFHAVMRKTLILLLTWGAAGWPLLGHATGGNLTGPQADSIKRELPALQGKRRMQALYYLVDHYEEHRADSTLKYGDMALAEARAQRDYLRAADVLIMLSTSVSLSAVPDQMSRVPGWLAEAEALAKESRSPFYQGKVKETLGIYYESIDSTQEARDAFNEAIVYYRRLPKSDRALMGMANSLWNLGLIEERTGGFVRAVELYLEALTRADRLPDTLTTLRSKIFNSLAVTYSKRGNIDKAVGYYARSSAINLASGDSFAYAVNCVNLTVQLKKLSRYDEAREKGRQAYAIFGSLDFPYGQSVALHNLGSVEEGAQNLALARSLYLQSDSLHQASGSGIDEVYISNYIGLASLEVKAQRGKEALAFLARAEAALAKRKDVKKLKDLYEIQAKAHAIMGQYAEAYRAQQLFTQYADSIRNEDSSRKIAELEGSFTLSKMQGEVDALEERNSRQRMVSAGLLVGLLLVGMLGGTVAWSLGRLRKTHTELTASHHQLSEAHAMLNERNEEIIAQKEEISAQRDQLHDALEELKSTQERLIAAEKQATVAQMGANLAHEFNSPLGAIRTLARTARRSLPQLMEDWPRTLQQVPPAAAQLMHELLDKAVSHPQRLTTQQERAQRKAWEAYAAEHQLPLTSAGIKTLVATGRQTDQHAELAPILTLPQADDLLHLVGQMQLLMNTPREIEIATERTSRVVGTLKVLSEEASSQGMMPMSLEHTLEGVLELYKDMMGRVTVKREYAPALPPVPLRPDMIDLAWSNLVHNAIIATADVKDPAITVRTYQEDSMAVAEVIDNGPGIAPELHEKVFEPLFTTRPRGQGAGLGLEVVRRVADMFGGHLSMTSEPGRTVFRVYLPLAKERVALKAEVLGRR